MPEEDFHLSSQVHFQAHMPSLTGLVAALPLHCGWKSDCRYWGQRTPSGPIAKS